MTYLSTIQEYPVQEYDFGLFLPKGFRVLGMDVVYGEAKMFVLVDPVAPTAWVQFHVLQGSSRGENLGRMRFVGSFRPRDGHVFYHLFDARPPEDPLGHLEALAACGGPT